ncbi:hypothetical protein LINPERPRIM_LOCUS26711 [Linum perenne]
MRSGSKRARGDRRGDDHWGTGGRKAAPSLLHGVSEPLPTRTLHHEVQASWPGCSRKFQEQFC